MPYNNFSCAYIFLLIGNPRSKAIISDLVMTLYTGAKEGTISRGDLKPTSMAVISSNFMVNAGEVCLCKHCMAKTCMHIHALFCNYRCVNNFKALKTLMEKSSSAIGFIIGLGETFTQDSHDEMGQRFA